MVSREVFRDRLDRAEGGEVVKLQFQIVDIQFFRLCVGEDQRGVDAHFFRLVEADFRRVLVGQFDLDGEEKERGFDHRALRTLLYRAEDEGIADIQLVPPGFPFDVFDLPFQFLDFPDFDFHCVRRFFFADLVVLLRRFFLFFGIESGDVFEFFVKFALNIEVFENLFFLVVCDQRQRVLACGEEKIHEFRDLAVPSFEDAADVIGTFSDDAFQVQTFIVTADFDQALFIIGVNALSHAFPPAFCFALFPVGTPSDENHPTIYPY